VSIGYSWAFYIYSDMIAVTRDVGIQTSRCACGNTDEMSRANCHTTVLESANGFPLRRFDASSPSKWNLALLCLPKHPDFDKEMKPVEHINYLKIKTSGQGEGHC
jgi:hypothetical protein